MENTSSFCTCRDTACPLHPANHDKGCSPCIAKNLGRGEIPSCFFNKAGGTDGLDSFFFKDFAELVIKNDK